MVYAIGDKGFQSAVVPLSHSALKPHEAEGQKTPTGTTVGWEVQSSPSAARGNNATHLCYPYQTIILML